MIARYHFSKLILIAAGLLTLLAGVWIFIYPPSVFPDPGWGFQVMRGMRMGGGFNMLPDPDMDDMAKNAPSFLSWWSPGQYLAPYGLIRLFNINIGQAVAIIATLCSLLGLGGFYLFFKKTGFTNTIAAISIAFIATQQAYMVPFVIYNGGEVLLFAFAGWFLYGCTAIKKAGWLMAGFILLSGFIGFFCKSSFLWIYFSGSLYLWIRTSNSQKISAWIINGLCIGAPAILALAVIYTSYLSKGGNPASGVGIKLAWETFSFPIASPLLAGFSFDELTNGLILHISTPIFNPMWTIIVLVLFAVISIMLIVCIIRLVPLANYKLLVTVLYVVCILFFGISFLRQADISYEGRHMRIIGLIITPGVIYIVNRVKLSYRLVFGLLWIVIACSSFKYLYTGNHRNKYESARGRTGIAQLLIDQTTLNYIQLLDRQQHNAVFTFINPGLGLEIEHNRIITFDTADDNLQVENMYPYKGHAGPLYIILPLDYMGAKANLYLNSFPGYHNFTVYKPGNCLIYSAQ